MLRAAQRAAQGCDVMLVAGTSLEVMPLEAYPDCPERRRTIMSKHEPTFVDEQAACVLRGDVAECCPALAAAVGAARDE